MKRGFSPRAPLPRNLKYFFLRPTGAMTKASIVIVSSGLLRGHLEVRAPGGAASMAVAVRTKYIPPKARQLPSGGLHHGKLSYCGHLAVRHVWLLRYKPSMSYRKPVSCRPRLAASKSGCCGTNLVCPIESWSIAVRKDRCICCEFCSTARRVSRIKKMGAPLRSAERSAHPRAIT